MSSLAFGAGAQLRQLIGQLIDLGVRVLLAGAQLRGLSAGHGQGFAVGSQFGKAEKDALDAKAAVLSDELSTLKESSGRETSRLAATGSEVARLSAELAAEREALAVARQDSATLTTLATG